ncbi:metallophosphoesterase [Lentisphaerota bacterium ZTH]|nr:metallophosphoesterase [Lentisphaerota bacterium]WET06549.1 metallophosphoesterase [Lentisphaerota bacterium ZTH]
MKIKIAVLTDIHFRSDKSVFPPDNLDDLADVLLLRAVRRLNRYIRPDFVFIGGDLIEDPESEDAVELLGVLKKTLNLLQAPYTVIPGNHDGNEERFFKVFGRPEIKDINNFRLVPFVDEQLPGYKARRSEKDLQKMRQAAAEFKGTLIALQHVPVFPPEAGCCEYGCTNAAEICSVMRDNNYKVSLAGHYHAGFCYDAADGITYNACPALREKPFKYSIIEVDHLGQCSRIDEALAMPKELELCDHHIHTKLAYCNQNMDIARTERLAKAFNLRKIYVTEHTAHLYQSEKNYRENQYFYKGLNNSEIEDRTEEFFELHAGEASPNTGCGMELDYDIDGAPIIMPEINNKLEFRNGAVHCLASTASRAPMKEVEAEFLAQTQAVINSGVNALAHPFRIFRRRGKPLPRHLYEPVAEMLKAGNVAAELNFHANNPPLEFFRICIAKGVKISLGSDSHNLCQVGEFYPHLNFLKKIVTNQRLCDILLD